MDGFQKRKERKKEMIRRAAFELFSKYGVQKVTIEEIATKANVSQVTIYNYFGSKDELLYNTLKTLTEQTWEEYEKLLESDLPFHEKIEKIIFFEMKLAGELNPDFIRSSLVSNNPDIEQFLEDFYENKVLPSLIGFFKEGQEQGYVNKELSTKAILFYFNMFKNTPNWVDLLGDEGENARLSKELITMFFYGITGQGQQGN
ncbi:MAG TPA: TetR/AcrR family transcriptional regulator [Bacillales bacterium]